MKRKKKTNPRAKKKNISLTMEEILPQSDASLPARSVQQSQMALNTTKETILQTEASLPRMSPESIYQPGYSQAPEMSQCWRHDLDQYPPLPVTQLIAPCQQTELVSSDSDHCNVHQEKGANNIIQTPASEQAGSSCPEGPCSVQPFQVMPPELKENEPQQQDAYDIPVLMASQIPRSPEDLDRVCQGQVLLGGCLVLTGVWASNTGDLISNGWGQTNCVRGPEDIQNVPKTEVSGCSTGISVIQSQIKGKADSLQEHVLRADGSLLPEPTFQSTLEIFHIMKNETQEERASAQLQKQESQLQQYDISLPATISQLQSDPAQQQGTELQDNITPLKMHTDQVPALVSRLEDDTSQQYSQNDATHLQGQQGSELKEEALRSGDQDGPVAQEAIPSPEGENSQLAVKIVEHQGEDPPAKQPPSFLDDQNSWAKGGHLESTKACPLNAQSSKFSNLEAQTSSLVVQGASGAGFEVPDSQMLGVLDNSLNEPDQTVSDVTAVTRRVSSPSAEEITQRANVVSHPKPFVLSSGPAADEEGKDEDASSMVQGLISELSNLNRLIMTMHRDLRLKRGKVAPGRGVLAGRKRRREM